MTVTITTSEIFCTPSQSPNYSENNAYLLPNIRTFCIYTVSAPPVALTPVDIVSRQMERQQFATNILLTAVIAEGVFLSNRESTVVMASGTV